jgi:thiol-disulfide isomerase/thioredoxin
VIALTKDASSRVVLLNVWATWCPPCREELPAIARLAREMRTKGLKVVLVSADSEDVPLEKIAAQLETAGIDFQTYVRADDVPTLKKGLLEDWNGGIPATFLYGPEGELLDYWEGKATLEAFEDKVRLAMSGT